MIDDFTDITNARGSRQGQIDAVRGAIGSDKRFSETKMNQAEAQGGAPLSSTAAGQMMGEGSTAGLIGKNKLAQAVFAGSAIFGDPSLVAALLFTSPKFIARAMQGLSLGARGMREVNSVIKKITDLPGAKPLVEQGLTFGAILEQLEREQPSLLGRIGNASNSQ